jgi:hypothetical protein
MNDDDDMEGAVRAGLPPALRQTVDLDLRDWFANAALNGVLACGGGDGATFADLADHAYRIAEAMIERRKRGKS